MDRRLLVVLGVGVLVVALVLGGLDAVDRFRGGASSPTALVDRVLAAADQEDVGALLRLVEPDERAALVRFVGAWSQRLDDLALPAAVVGDPSTPTDAGDALDGLTIDVSGATPTVGARSGGLAVVDLGDVAVRVRRDPDRAHGLLRVWSAYRHENGPQDRTYRAESFPAVGALPRLVTVERSGRWYLSVLATLLGPDVANGGLPSVRELDRAPSPSARAAVEASLRALLDGTVRTDATRLAGTLDRSGSDAVQLWAAEVATTGLDRSPIPIGALSTSDGPTDGVRTAVRVDTLRVGEDVDLSGRCLTITGTKSCLHPSGYRYGGGLGSLSAFEVLGRDGAFSLTAVQGPGGWLTSLPESVADALVGYADGLTREQVLMVLNEERLDAPAGALEPDRAEDVAFTSGGYAVRTVTVARAGLYRVVPGTDGATRSTLYEPDGEPSLQPFFPNDSVYRLAAGEHTLLVWAGDGFDATLDRTGGDPYVERVEVRSVR